MHPEHTADFEKSGLTFETVAALGLHTVPPYKIKHLPGVNHAYRIPYFQLDGSTNCFERLKLFPPIKTKDGHTKKYHQEKGSDPQLYLPSLRPWAELARTVTEPILICEGEKKAALACQLGLNAIAVSGLWCWRQRTDKGDRLTIPTLDLITWSGRTTGLVPDFDAWTTGREFDLLAGFYCLGQSLASRGADVHLMKLPGGRTRALTTGTCR